MPHLTIEYSANVADNHNIDDLVTTVHQAAISHGLASVGGLRTRAAVRDHYRVADGRPDFAFIAIAARVGPGRDEETRQTFVEFVLDRAMENVGDSPLTIAWSMEITELDPRFRINRNQVRELLQEEQTQSGSSD